MNPLDAFNSKYDMTLKSFNTFYVYLLVAVFNSLGQTLESATSSSYVPKYDEKKDFYRAIKHYENLSNYKIRLSDPALYCQSKLNLARIYLELGTYHLSIETLENLLAYLSRNDSVDYLAYAKAHKLLADNYDYLFLHQDFLLHIEEFYRYFQKHDTTQELYAALYHSYLGKYYNLKFDIQTAFEHTNKSLEIYHRNKHNADLIPVHLLYQNHCFTLRNYDISENIKLKYLDTFRVEINKKSHYSNIEKAKDIFGLTSFELDKVYNLLTNADAIQDDISRQSLINTVCVNYNRAISIFHEFGIFQHDLLPRFYDLQGWLHFANKDYNKVIQLLQKGLSSYTEIDFLNQGIVSNNYRVLNNVRFALLNYRELRKQGTNSTLERKYFQLLKRYEKLWENYLSDYNTLDIEFVSSMYNQSPYQYLFEYYSELYMTSGIERYIQQAHKYMEKAKYNSVLTKLSLSPRQKAQSDILNAQKNQIYLLLDQYYLAKLFNTKNKELLKKQMEDLIQKFNYSKFEFDVFGQQKIEHIKQIQEELGNHEAIVSYNTLDFNKIETYVMILTKKNVDIIKLEAPQISSMTDYREIITKIKELLMNNEVEAYKDMSYALYMNLFEPVNKKLPDGLRTIHILPSPSIENLPFDLLLTSKSHAKDYRKLPYLAHDYYFSYRLSSSINKLNNSKEHAFSSSIDAFTPIFSNTNQSVLDYVEKTSEILHNQYNAHQYEKTDANLENFKNSLMNTRVISFISHGSSNSRLSMKDKGVYLQDHFLSVDEVHHLEANTKFLMLTACQTGVGFSDNGEGSISLVRAFSSIGVQSILYAVWDIDEKPSMDILIVFMANLNLKMKKSEALTEAKKNYLKTCHPRYANPIFWAGLNIMGNNEAIDLSDVVKNKWSSFKLTYLLFVLSILAILFIIFTKKSFKHRF